MKIAFLVVNLGCGGVERTVTYLSDYFASKGHETSIICISDDQFYKISKRVNLIKLNIPYASKNIFERLCKIVIRFNRINKIIKSLNPDCLVCLDVEMLRFIQNHVKSSRIKVITSERNNPLMDSDSKRRKKLRFFRESDGIVFQTERAKKCFPNDIAEKGVVIPNAVGNDYVFKTTIPNVRRKVITAAGRLTQQKDYPTLIKAFKKFSASHPDYSLEIFGKGEDEVILKQLVTELGLNNVVRFMGAVPDSIISVSSSACYVMSSLYEGMPNALMEAMAVGTPCISTDCPFGPSELMKNGVDGLLVPVNDPEKLCEAMNKMVDDTEFAKKCSANARKIIERQSIEKVSQLYLDYILAITNNH